MLEIKKEKLVFHYDTEEVWIEPWGANALRIRATKEHKMPEENWALHERGNAEGEITYTEQGAKIVNGKIRAEITKLGKIMIYNAEDKLLLEEAETGEIYWIENAVQLKWKHVNLNQYWEEIII